MPETFLSIDPGTRHTGLAVFDGDRLAFYGIISPPAHLEVDERITHIVERLEAAMAPVKDAVRLVVVERSMAIDKVRPAPELQTLIRRLESWTKKRMRWRWLVYHPSTVAASVRLRGMEGDRKAQLRMGVTALYSPGLPVDVHQDVIDAVAVGHCHLSKTRVEGLEGCIHDAITEYTPRDVALGE